MEGLGANDWIKYGWSTKLSSEFTPGEPLVVDCSNYISIDYPTALDAAIQTVHTIVREYPAPYTLMCSGGVDSQAMLWAWHKSGQPYTVLSVKYISDSIWFNQHDISTLVQFSELHSIPITYAEFDVIEFLENNLSAVATINECDSPQICTHIQMTNLVPEGTAIFSGNYMSLEFQIPLTYTLLGMHRYARQLKETSKLRVVPFFFLHTPELSHSFKKPSTNHTGYLYKCDIYSYNGFPVIAQSKKYTGFEQLKEYYDRFSDRVSRKARIVYSEKPSNRVFDLLFRYPYHTTGKSQALSKLIFAELKKE